MTRVVALVAFSTGAITMEEKGVYEIDNALATDLIAQGLVADAATYFGGGGSGGGVLVVTDTEGVLDKTWQEIHDSDFTSIKQGDLRGYVKSTGYDGRSELYEVRAEVGGENHIYSAISASGYPFEN